MIEKFENKDCRKETLKSADDMLEELRKLQNTYLKTESCVDQALIRNDQEKLFDDLILFNDSLLVKAFDKSLPEHDRDNLVAEYGRIADQLAILAPWEGKARKERNMQFEAIKNIEKYLNFRPHVSKAHHALFMLYHHGAGISISETDSAYKQIFNGEKPSESFSVQYVEAENKALPHLEMYLASVFDKKGFTINSDFGVLLDIDDLSESEFSAVIDVANWYRRIALYEKYAAMDNTEHLKKAIKLHKKIVQRDPEMQQFLDMIYNEQDINFNYPL